MRTRTAAFAIASAAVLPAGLALAAAPAQAQESTATVSVFHGVPGLTVDVYANDQPLLEDFAPGTLTDPLELPAGSYDLAVFPAGEGPNGQPAIKADNVEVPAGANATVAAHLDEGGQPKLTAFVNDTTKVAAGEGRLTVRHTAAAPAVDVRANGDAVFTGLSNPDEAKAEVPAGAVEADVVLAGTSDVAIGPADLEIAEGANTIVYAWGSGQNDNLELKVQTISGLHSAPGGVPAGTGGLADDDGGLPAWAIGLIGVAAVGAGYSGVRLARSRS